MLRGALLLRILLLSCLTLASLLFLWLAFSDRHPISLPTEELTAKPDKAYFPPTSSLCDDGSTGEQICDSFPRHLLSDVHITIKTGVGERPLLEALLNTYASCIPNISIVSDASYTVNGHEVHDILADLPTNYTYDPDWTAYTKQQEALAAGLPVEKNHGAWRLDRFKFLPMVEYAYARQPSAKWFVFIETDVYMFWDTLFRILDRLDHSEPHYLGEAMVGAWDRWFAYGGAGFVLSQGLLQNLTLSGPDRLSAKHEFTARDDCCGDAVLAYVLHAELGVRLGNMYPTFSGDEPHWAAVRQENWCAPLLSLHRVKAEQMEALWRWERCRASTERAITFAAFLDYGLASILANGTTRRVHWNNGANIEQRYSSIKSADACFAACETHSTCLQASWSEGKCRFGRKVRPGHAVETEMESSWDLEKLQQHGWRPGVNDSSSLCTETTWLEPKLMLPPKDWAQFFGFKDWP